jgi:hypothetical protein
MVGIEELTLRGQMSGHSGLGNNFQKESLSLNLMLLSFPETLLVVGDCCDDVDNVE